MVKKSRNDSTLYSVGRTRSATERHAAMKAAREERQEKNEAIAFELGPVTDIVKAFVAAEKKQIELDLLKHIGMETPDEDVKAQLAALNLFDSLVTRFENRLILQLRDVKPRPTPEVTPSV